MRLDIRISDQLDITSTMIYKIRRGDRHPSIKIMKQIEQKTGWNIANQIEARTKGTYGEEFERVWSHGTREPQDAVTTTAPGTRDLIAATQ